MTNCIVIVINFISIMVKFNKSTKLNQDLKQINDQFNLEFLSLIKSNIYLYK